MLAGLGDQSFAGETAQDSGDEGFELSDEGKEIAEQARLSQLMTEDPLAYEQEMIDANLYPRDMDGRQIPDD